MSMLDDIRRDWDAEGREYTNLDLRDEWRQRHRVITEANGVDLFADSPYRRAEDERS